MPRTHEHPLAVALRTAMDYARPVRGKDEVALRAGDWHAVEDEIRKATGSDPGKIDRAAEAMWQAESMRASDRPRLIAWTEEAEDIRDKWRGLALAAYSV